MHCTSSTVSHVSKFAFALTLAAGQLSLAVAEESFPLHVPQAFSSGRAAAQIDEYRPTDEVELVRERYPDGKVRVERQVTLDSEGNYVNHGAWKLYSPSGSVLAEGQFDMGKRVGAWTRWLGRNDSPLLKQFPFNRFKTPFASQAIFNDDVMDGEWLIVDANNHKALQVSLSDGHRHGQVITFLPNGKEFRQETFENGVPVGDVLEIDSKSGELKQVATYLDGRRIVTKTNHYRGGRLKKSEEMFLAATTVQKSADSFWNTKLAEYASEGEDLRHGTAKTWFENGQVQIEGFYRSGLRDGNFTYWYSNGQVAATGEYKDDLPNDVWVWWHSNGQKAAVGTYEAGALVDQWRWWDEQGQLARQKVYDGTEVTASTEQDVLRLGQVPDEVASK